MPILLYAALGFGAAGDTASEAASDAADGDANSVQPLTVSSGTLLRVEVIRRSRLREGSPVEGRLLEPVYAEDRLLIPTGAVLQGKVIEARPAPRHKRVDAKLHGDFTPLREPVIQWTKLTRSDGSEYPLLGESTTGAGGTLYFRESAAPVQRSLFRRAWSSVTRRKTDAGENVEAPSKGERLQRYFWSQMPFHPQYLNEGTRYEMTLAEDLCLSAGPLPLQTDPNQPKPLPGLVWVYSRLQSDIDSATAKAGDPVEAIVTAPVLDERNQLVLPQNSVLHGKILSATASGRWGHNGSLRFAFDQVSWPTGFTQEVQATPTAVESNAAAKISIDQEGGVALQNEHSIAAPLVMGLLSGAAIGDDDGGLGRAAISSNGFAIAGHVAALASGSRYVGGSIGAVATGRSIYTHWLAHGKETHFGPDTEVVLEMTPAHAHRMSREQ